MTVANQPPAGGDPPQADSKSQDGAVPPADGGQQQPPAPQEQQQQSAAAGQATQEGQPPASAEQQPPDGTRDPYQLLDELLGTAEGKGVFETALQMYGEGAQKPPTQPAGEPPAAGAQADTAGLQQRADAGDADAKAELYDRQIAARSRQGVIDEGKQAGRNEALQAFFAAPEIQGLGQGDRMRIADTYLKGGAVAALNQAIGILRGAAGSEGTAASGEDAAAEAAKNQQTAAQQKGGAPQVPGATVEEGPTPQEGQSAVEALENAIAYKDQQ